MTFFRISRSLRHLTTITNSQLQNKQISKRVKQLKKVPLITYNTGTILQKANTYLPKTNKIIANFMTATTYNKQRLLANRKAYTSTTPT